MNDNNNQNNEKKSKPAKNWGSGGGLYKSVKVPVFVLNIFIVIGIVALAAVIIMLSVKGGFSVSFDTAGGTAIQAQSVKYGKPVTDPGVPEKTGYTFEGWYLDSEYTKKWDNNGVIEKEVTLYAKWEPVSVKILFDTNGGFFEKNEAFAEKEVTFGEEYGALPVPVRDGFDFSGWYYKDAIIMEKSIVKVNGEHILKAMWTEVATQSEIQSETETLALP